MPIADSVREHISELVTQHRVVLFMKGTRRVPQCGFSASVVQALDAVLPDYETVDVLRSPELREGIKEFSSWPTIPQLYVDGKFIGGADIVRELNASGELNKLLGGEGVALEVPSISVSDAATRAFQAAMGDAEDEVLRLTVTAQFEHDLFFGPSAPGDVEVRLNGLSLRLDPASARRAQGVSIDFVDGPQGGFKITNPNQPAAVKKLSVSDAKALLDRGELNLFDVRPGPERELASIAGATPLDAGGRERLAELGRDAPIAFHCHHGVRSRAVAEQCVREGFKNVYNVEGGIDAWSALVDPSVPRY